MMQILSLKKGMGLRKNDPRLTIQCKIIIYNINRQRSYISTCNLNEKNNNLALLFTLEEDILFKRKTLRDN